MSGRIDEVGKRYGLLEVVAIADRILWRGRHAEFFAVCNCGGFVQASGKYLRSGVTRSCGCLEARTFTKDQVPA